MTFKLDQLDKLENQSIFIIREAYSQFRNVAMLWSIFIASVVLSSGCAMEQSEIG